MMFPSVIPSLQRLRMIYPMLPSMMLENGWLEKMARYMSMSSAGMKHYILS